MNRSPTAAGLGAFAMAATLTGLPPRRGFSLSFYRKDMNNPYYGRMGDRRRGRAEERHRPDSSSRRSSYGDIEASISVVETELIKGHDAIVLVPMDGRRAHPKVREANGLGNSRDHRRHPRR